MLVLQLTIWILPPLVFGVVMLSGKKSLRPIMPLHHGLGMEQR